MRAVRHPQTKDPWNRGWAEIDSLRAEVNQERTERDRLAASIAAKVARMTELLAILAEEAGIEALPKTAPEIPDAPVNRGPTPTLIDGKTRKERALKALYQLGRPVTVREVADLLQDDYTPVYNALNDMRLPDKNGGKALTMREDKQWTLTNEGRKEAERLMA